MSPFFIFRLVRYSGYYSALFFSLCLELRWASCRLYHISFSVHQTMFVNHSANKMSSQFISYFPFQSFDLDITRISISLFLAVFWSLLNSLSAVLQLSLHVTQKLFLCFIIHSYIHTFITHFSFYHLSRQFRVSTFHPL